MKNEIISIISDYLDIPEEELEDYKTFEDLNIDSLDFVEILFEIEEKFGAPIIFEMQDHKNELHNLGDAVRLIEEQIVNHRKSEPVENSA